MLKKSGEFALSLASKYRPWTNVYGLARTLLAVGTILTLFFNEPEVLFRPGSGIATYPICQGAGIAGIFCLASPHLEIARWLAIVILLVVASGWRPRYTAIFHWWIAISLQTSAITLDGGDQVTTVLTFLLLPIALTDKRTWHWQEDKTEENLTARNISRSLAALSASFAIRVQVAIIYFHAATAKLSLDEWVDGTILYYWLTDSVVGLPEWLRFITPIFTSPLVVVFTWGSLLLEILLFMALGMPKHRWKYLLVAGITFHAGIALMMGLISFGFAMTAALVLYLRPFEQPFDFSFAKRFVTNLYPKKERISATPAATRSESLSF